jgi:hypothetical protein
MSLLIIDFGVHEDIARPLFKFGKTVVGKGCFP